MKQTILLVIVVLATFTMAFRTNVKLHNTVKTHNPPFLGMPIPAEDVPDAMAGDCPVGSQYTAAGEVCD